MANREQNLEVKMIFKLVKTDIEFERALITLKAEMAERAERARRAEIAEIAERIERAWRSRRAEMAETAESAESAERAESVARAECADGAERPEEAKIAQKAMGAERAKIAEGAERVEIAVGVEIALEALRLRRAEKAERRLRRERARVERRERHRANRAERAERANRAGRARRANNKPCVVQFPQGRHLIGRGKFLDCNHKIVSRNHAELEVTEDAIILKALHEHPCFFIKKNTDFIDILKQNCTVKLTNGDKFGFLPHLFWYELVLCSDDKKSPELEEPLKEENSPLADELEGDQYQLIMDIWTYPASEAMNVANYFDEDPLFDVDENGEQSQGSPFHGPAEFPVMQSQDSNEKPGPSFYYPPNILTSAADELINSNEVGDQQASAKRPHSAADTNEGFKKMKVEPDVQANPEPQPGPSDEQMNQNPANDGKAGLPPSPVAPNAPARERCMNGANCYGEQQKEVC